MGQLITIISGVSYDKKDVCKNRIRILRGGNIQDLKVSIFKEDVFLPESYKDIEKQVQINDILIVASTGSKAVIGKAGYIVKELINTQIGAFLRIVRPLYNDVNSYIKLLFATDYYREHIRTQSQGTNINNVKAEYITKLLVPIPPLEEQERIVAEIEKYEPLIAEYDKLEQQKTKLDTEIYDKLKKSILQYAIQGKLVPQNENDEPASVLLEKIRVEKKAKLGKKYVDSYIYKGDDNCYYEKVGNNEPILLENLPFDIPDSWCWCRLGTMFQHNTGKALNSSDIKGTKHKYISTSNLYWGFFKLDILREMLFTEEEIEKCSVKFGDLLVCEGGDIGRAAVWSYDYPMFIQNHIHKLRPYYGINIKFFYYIFYVYKNIGLIGGKGIGIQGLSSNVIDSMMLPLPPIEEQNRIVKQLEILFTKLKDEN